MHISTPLLPDTNIYKLPLQVITEEELEEGEADWDTEWVNDETGVSQEVEWFVEDEDRESPDEVYSLCRSFPPIVQCAVTTCAREVPCL